MSEKNTTRADGLHCVYGQCQAAPHFKTDCNPGCYFSMRTHNTTAWEPPYKRLLECAELLRSQGRITEAAKLAWEARTMIYAHHGVLDKING